MRRRREGFNKEGYDKDGYDRFHYDKAGYDRDGWDVKVRLVVCCAVLRCGLATPHATYQ